LPTELNYLNFQEKNPGKKRLKNARFLVGALKTRGIKYLNTETLLFAFPI